MKIRLSSTATSFAVTGGTGPVFYECEGDIVKRFVLYNASGALSWLNGTVVEFTDRVPLTAFQGGGFFGIAAPPVVPVDKIED